MKTTKEQIIADITAKVEAKLASHKVDLATLDFIKSMLTDSKAIYKRSVEWAKEMETFTKKTRVLNADASALSNAIEKELKQFQAQAKQLGLDVTTLPEFKETMTALGPLDTTIKMTARFK